MRGAASRRHTFARSLTICRTVISVSGVSCLTATSMPATTPWKPLISEYLEGNIVSRSNTQSNGTTTGEFGLLVHI
jgi:hypothetical protein